MRAGLGEISVETIKAHIARLDEQEVKAHKVLEARMKVINEERDRYIDELIKRDVKRMAKAIDRYNKKNGTTTNE